MYSTDPAARQDYITALRDLADYLDAHPDVPCPRSSDLTVHADALENGGREQVNQIAAALGTGIASYSSDTHYYAEERKFGPISFCAVSISDAAMARWQALTSYADCVTPDNQALSA